MRVAAARARARRRRRPPLVSPPAPRRRARASRAAHNPYKLAGLCLIPLLELHVEGLTPGAPRTLSGSCSALLQFLGGLFSFRVQPALRTLARSLYYNLPPNATSEKKLEDEGINAILAQSTDAKKKKKANKKKKKAGGGEGGDGDGETKEGGE